LSSDITTGIVRILDDGDQPIGTGFMVLVDGLIATCAHILGEPLPMQVTVAFPATGEKRTARGIPTWWRSIETGDVAFLQVDGDLPKGVQPLLLGSSAGTSTHQVHTFGFPDVGEVEGVWGRGTVLGQVTEAGLPLLQVWSNEITVGFSGAPVWDESRRRVIGMVVEITKPDRYLRMDRTAFAIPSETLRSICPALQVSDVCPYRGLEAFTEQDHEFFFGRERAVEKLLKSLKSSPHFLTVLGPSGSGKSSLVQAGLLRHLHKGTWLGTADHLNISVSRPGSDPFAELTLQGLGIPQMSLRERVQAWRNHYPEKKQLVLIFDQFEELWTNCTKDTALDFINQLTTLVHATDSASYTTIILVMRDDFYSRIGQHEVLADLVDQSLVRITRTLRRPELTAIVQEPAAAVGMQFASGLIDTIVEDVFGIHVVQLEDEPCADSTILPLLEFALTQLWELRQDGEFTHEAYYAIERVSGGLTVWADKTFFSIEERLRPLVRAIFLQLIHVGDEMQNIPDSRRRRPLTSLLALQSQPDDVHRVISHLAKARLLVTERDLRDGQESVEIIHDVLLREWRRLKDWITQNRSFLAWHQDFEKRVQIWVESDSHDLALRDKGRLLYGRDLDEARHWMEERAIDLAPIEQDYINASQEQADHQHQVTIARQLVAQAELIRVQQSDIAYRSVILAAEAMRRVPSVEVDQALRNAMAFIPHPLAHLNHQKKVQSLAFSPRGEYLVTASADGTVCIWEMPKATLVTLLSHEASVNALAFSPDGQYLATASSDHTVGFWETTNWQQITRFAHRGPVKFLAFSPDGQYLATASEDHTARLWEIASRQQLADLKHDDEVNAVVFSPNGQYLATASSDQRARVWEIASGQRLAQLPHRMRVLSVAFSPDGQCLATASEDSTAGIWEVPSGQQLKSLRHEWMVGAVVFSPDGRYLVTSGGDRFARVWEMPEGRLLTRIPHDGNTKSAAFSADGRYLATTGDPMVFVCEVGSWHQFVCLIGGYKLHTVAFSPAGQYLATAGEGSTANMWEITNRHSLAQLTCEKVKVMAFAPDSQHVVTASDTQVTRWNVASRKKLSSFEFRTLPFGEVKLSSDGHYLAVASQGLWDTESGQELINFMGRTVAFSADGASLATTDARGNVVAVETKTGRYSSLSHKDLVNIIVFSSDRRYLATASDRPSGSGWSRRSPVAVWELAHGRLLASLPQEELVDKVMLSPRGSYLVIMSNAEVIVWETNTRSQLLHLPHDSGYDSAQDIAFSPDERYFAVARSFQIQVYDTVKQRFFEPLKDELVRGVMFSPNGRYLATKSDDRHACVWEIPSGHRLAYLGHQDRVVGMAFSPDSHYLVTASWDTSASLWETTTGSQLCRFNHDVRVTDVSFSSDGKYVTSLDWDDTLRVWLWRPEDMIAEARAHMPRNLTTQEWQTYLGNEPYRKLYPDLL
jgi:WD40 repeat protein